MTRSVAHHESDTRRTLRGHDANWLKGYIGRHVVRILIADEELTKLNEQELLSPAMKKALFYLRHLAEE